MNNMVSAYTEGAGHPPEMSQLREPMRVVQPLVVAPSEDFAVVASSLLNRLPASLRFMLDALGTPDAKSADLTSYLLFDPAYTRALLDIGYRDAAARIDEIEAFLRRGEQTRGVHRGEVGR